MLRHVETSNQFRRFYKRFSWTHDAGVAFVETSNQFRRFCKRVSPREPHPRKQSKLLTSFAGSIRRSVDYFVDAKAGLSKLLTSFAGSIKEHQVLYTNLRAVQCPA